MILIWRVDEWDENCLDMGGMSGMIELLLVIISINFAEGCDDYNEMCSNVSVVRTTYLYYLPL